MRWAWAVLLACGMAMAGDGDNPRDMNGGDGFGLPGRDSSSRGYGQRDRADMQRRLWRVRTRRNPTNLPSYPGPMRYHPWEPDGRQPQQAPAMDPTGDPNGPSDDLADAASEQEPQATEQEEDLPPSDGLHPWRKKAPRQPVPKPPVTPPVTK